MTIKNIPLKRRNPENPQIRSYTDAVQRGQNSYHVLYSDKKKGWAVKKIGTPDERFFSTQNKAVQYAQDIAKKRASEIFVHSESGLIRERRSYAEK